ncbi:hypothetical protein DACRYDRAFT_103515 [Dacryopinax primogenitus]|uniref:NADH dehydrogenase [ubiquinone] 1 beta subcomplex subunit 9 n=1 Tax=Dacryopinax primogenitus (strain DJM 731) TaxID=1858805 RepID=M5GC27_DACPD|nr:uncharacterized protein DACRYDRAFT_103515 [Dacryopinax primogenitus]EJU06569.1 hypothetical protein DACRYDRAFT_103515 [Dacryopinax primogenitus]
MSASAYAAAHRLRVKTLYKAMLKDSLDWTIQRDLWRTKAIEIRAMFERNMKIQDPRRVEILMQEAEAAYEKNKHPDPLIWAQFYGGTRYERNLPPPMGPPVERH